MNLIVTATSQGLLWGVMALGIFITFRILDLPDMTAEGSFPLGAAVCAKLILSGVHPIIATLVAFISGMLAGAITGFLITLYLIIKLITTSLRNSLVLYTAGRRKQ